ncbi:energy transducer TonB family protein [Lacinutrix chionoecetis]
MKFENSHKALAITLLISASIVLSLFSYDVVKQNKEIAETLIDITPPDLIDDINDEPEDEKPSQKTNKGYNETKEYKHFAQAYKPIAPPKDYENPLLRNKEETPTEIKKPSKSEGNSHVKNDELTSFESVNSILNRRANATQQATNDNSVNKNSSIIYSLKGRTDTFLPIPIYLCEANGKIVVNITVNNRGKVINTAINTSSTSTNECLKEHALEFAKKARFNASSKPSQIGTITFNFEGK